MINILVSELVNKYLSGSVTNTSIKIYENLNYYLTVYQTYDDLTASVQQIKSSIFLKLNYNPTDDSYAITIGYEVPVFLQKKKLKGTNNVVALVECVNYVNS